MRYVFCLAALAAAVASPAEAAPVTSLQKLPTGIELRTSSGVLILEPWSDATVHVRFGPAGYAGNYNPSVIAAPKAVAFTLRQTPAAYLLSTSRLTVRVDRNSSNVSFLDSGGHVLLSEADRSIGKGTVEAFGTRTPLYGLGEHQNGLLDYSGSTIHLQQKNGDVAVPMMLSPAGFGILWNNASVMDVDVAKPGAQFPLVIRNEAGAGIDY